MLTGENITQILLALIALFGSIATGVFIPWITGRISADKTGALKFWVKTGVAAAEQTFADPETGMQKKQFVREFLSSKGIDITTEELETLIEAAVYELKLSSDALAEYGVQ